MSSLAPSCASSPFTPAFECGLFAEALHGLDAIAVGPTLSDVHTPDESMELASAERFYELLIDVLKRLAA